MENRGILAVIFHNIKLRMLKSEGGLGNPAKLLTFCKNLMKGMAFLSPLQNICMVTHSHTHTILIKDTVGFLCNYNSGLEHLSNGKIY